MTGLRGRVSIAGGALMILAGLAIPAATAIPATAATPASRGVDVSSLQHLSNPSINWADVAAAGNAFVGIKVTEGNYYTNPYYEGNVAKHYESDVQQATAAGLYVTPYVFANPYPGNGTAVGQADYAASVINSVASPAYASSGLMLPLTVDLEADPYVNSEANSNQCYGLSHSAMVTWITQFLSEARAKIKTSTKKTPIIYTTANWWDACTGNSTAFSGYPLWLASYGVTNPALPSGWNNPTFWQYTSSGTVNGIKGGTDLDYLGPVLQVSQAGKQIGPVQLQTLNSLNGKPVSYTPATVLPGLTVNSAGQITGTPSQIGSHQVTVTPSAGAVPASMTFTWDVHGTLTVNSPGNRTTVVGTPVGLRVTASDQDTGYPVSLAASGLPTGLSMNSSGQITGWPSKPGTFKVTVSASDGLYASGSMSFTWTIKAASGSGVTGPIRQVGGSGKCLDDPYSKTANGTPVDLWNCNGHSNQQWTAVQDGTIRVLGKCLGVVGESKVNGARLQLWSCNSGDGAQQWQAGSDGELVNPQSGKCLDVPVSSAANGTQPVLESCANVTNQHWLRPAAAVLSGEPGKCLSASGSAVELAGCANVAAQHWTAEADGTFRLSGKCLTAAAGTVGSGLSVGSCSGTAATKWTLVAVGPIATEIANTASGLCVTVPSSGTALAIESCAATPAATWHVE